MRRILLSIAIASCIAAPAVLAQGRSGGAGGPPSGGPAVGGSIGGPSTGGQSAGRSSSGAGHATFSTGSRTDTLRATAAQRRAEAQARRAAAGSNAAQQAAFGQDTAERAKLLKDADLETRKAFGTYQAALAKQKSLEAKAGAAATASMGNSANANNSAFGKDTATRAKALKDADLETRKAFGALQAALAKAKALGSTVELVTTASVSASGNASFGHETSTRAKAQRDATVDTRKTFGKTQSELARAQERGDRADDDGDE